MSYLIRLSLLFCSNICSKNTSFRKFQHFQRLKITPKFFFNIYITRANHPWEFQNVSLLKKCLTDNRISRTFNGRQLAVSPCFFNVFSSKHFFLNVHFKCTINNNIRTKLLPECWVICGNRSTFLVYIDVCLCVHISNIQTKLFLPSHFVELL